MNSHEEKFYEIAAGEVAERRLSPAAFAKAFGEADGDERKTVARYIAIRVEQLAAEYQQQLVDAEKRQRMAEIEAKKRALQARQGKTCFNCNWYEPTLFVSWFDQTKGQCQFHHRLTYADDVCENHACKE